MPVSVESRIHRTLRKLDRFKECDHWAQLPQLEGIPSPLTSGEKLIGAYENIPMRVDQILLFTNLGLHLWNGVSWQTLNYADIVGTDWPKESKNKATTLVIRMKNGRHETIPVAGALFEVMRFIDRVIEDIKLKA
jgi:hypothetical protein